MSQASFSHYSEGHHNGNSTKTCVGIISLRTVVRGLTGTNSTLFTTRSVRSDHPFRDSPHGLCRHLMAPDGRATACQPGSAHKERAANRPQLVEIFDCASRRASVGSWSLILSTLVLVLAATDNFDCYKTRAKHDWEWGQNFPSPTVVRR